MRFLRSNITDAVINRHASSDVLQISDLRFPVKFRYRQDRTKGSWFVVRARKGGEVWRKVGTYPAITPKALFKRLPDIMAELSINEQSKAIGFSRFNCTGDLLDWYAERMSGAMYLSENRRKAIQSIVNSQLKPSLGAIPIGQLNREKIDDALVVPMQSTYSVAYIRQVFDVLRLALNKAYDFRKIEHNPLAGIKFSDFISTPIKPKAGKLGRHDLPELFARINDGTQSEKMLCLLMLLHGTRIGETRMHRWDHIDWGERAIIIPDTHTKNRDGHLVPLSDTAVALLKKFRMAQEDSGYKGAFIFPNHRGGSIDKTKAQRFIYNVSDGAWHSHDLRKLATRMWQDLGIDYMVIQRLLNHRMNRLDQAYMHKQIEDLKRLALDKYHAWLMRIGLADALTGI